VHGPVPACSARAQIVPLPIIVRNNCAKISVSDQGLIDVKVMAQSQSAPWLSILIGTEHCRFRAGPQPQECAPVHSLWSLSERLKQVDAAA